MNNTIIANGIEYLLYESIERIAPAYCRGSKRASMLIERHNIDKNNYSYIKDKGFDKWEILDNEAKPGRYVKLAFKKAFIDTLPEVANAQVVNVQQANAAQDVQVNNDGNKAVEYQNAPDIIKLEDNEKFKDADGKVIEIETRGERKHDKIYFRVKDVAAGFGMEKLYYVIIDIRYDGYKEDLHYKYFMRQNNGLPGKNTDKKLYKRELFLTYLGILRVLFASQTKHAEQFAKWAAETLFTMQMGSKQQKRELVSTVLGVDAQSIKHVFDTTANELPSIYLFSLGYVRDLRVNMSIDAKYEDDSIVFKYGFTKELKRRTAEHLKTFGEIAGVELRLKHYAYVDPQYLSKAESNIRTTITNMGVEFKYNNMEELFVIPKKSLGFIEEQYSLISSKYMGHSAELINRMRDMEAQHLRELTEERHKNELLEREIERLRFESELAAANIKSTHSMEVAQLKSNTELIIKDYENKLLIKDMEVMRVKLAYYEGSGPNMNIMNPIINKQRC